MTTKEEQYQTSGESSWDTTEGAQYEGEGDVGGSGAGFDNGFDDGYDT